jgi:hypothetical protein
MPLVPALEQLQPARVQLAVEARDEVDRLAGEDLLRDGAQNCASSVEPKRASVELPPPLTAFATRSK